MMMMIYDDDGDDIDEDDVELDDVVMGGLKCM